MDLIGLGGDGKTGDRGALHRRCGCCEYTGRRDAAGRPGLEGAKWICSPPMRRTSDQEALWQALALGDLQTVSSDHAPYRFDAGGKLVNGDDPDFKAIPNGLPGLQARLPLLFDAMVSQSVLGLTKFVSITATEPAKIYGLHPRKGEIMIGADADIAIWDPDRAVKLSGPMMRDLTGYTPYEGRTVTGWPVTVLSRGRVVIDDGALRVRPGSGRFLPRAAGAAAVPTDAALRSSTRRRTSAPRYDRHGTCLAEIQVQSQP